MTRELELLLDRQAEHLLLRSPEVGLFTRALPHGAWLAPGLPAGFLYSLGRCSALVVPRPAAGRVVNAPPELVLAPVGYGTVLYELAPLESGAFALLPSPEDAVRSRAGALVFPAPYSGRFWLRPTPGDPPFVKAGDVLGDGQTIGLIEVMKTFTHVVYRSGEGLPVRARVTAFCVEDGAEVSEREALLALEPA